MRREEDFRKKNSDRSKMNRINKDTILKKSLKQISPVNSQQNSQSKKIGQPVNQQNSNQNSQSKKIGQLANQQNNQLKKIGQLTNQQNNHWLRKRLTLYTKT